MHVQGLRLATVTLINPDTSLREFRLVGEALVQLCPLVTVYGDRKDVALTGASIVLGIHNAYVCPMSWFQTSEMQVDSQQQAA